MVQEQIKKVIIENYELYKEELGEEILSEPNCFSIPKESMNMRFGDLKIEFSSIFDNSIEDYKYNGLNNTVIINKKYIKREDISLPNLFMDIVLTIAYYNEKFKYSGFGNETYEALNKGFRESIVISITGEGRSREHCTSDEYAYENLFSRMFGVETLWEAFFKNNPDCINKKLREKSSEYCVKFYEANTEANRNSKVRHNKNGKSSLDLIQYKLAELLVLDNPTAKEVFDFQVNAVSNSEYFENHKKYDSLVDKDNKKDYKKILDDYMQTLNKQKNDVGKSY